MILFGWIPCIRFREGLVRFWIKSIHYSKFNRSQEESEVRPCHRKVNERLGDNPCEISEAPTERQGCDWDGTSLQTRKRLSTSPPPRQTLCLSRERQSGQIGPPHILPIPCCLLVLWLCGGLPPAHPILTPPPTAPIGGPFLDLNKQPEYYFNWRTPYRC